MLMNVKVGVVPVILILLTMLMIPIAQGQQTILVANFMNGNNGALNSRIYLWNPSDSPGDITVRVYTLPLRSGSPQELTGAPFSLGALGSRSAVNLKLAEDILIPLGIITPYVTDGGNLTLEFTIGAENVRGVAQVFSGSFAFGTYPLLETTSTIPDGSIGSVQLADIVNFGGIGSDGSISFVNSSGTSVASLGTSTIDGGVLNMSSSVGTNVLSLGVATTGGGIVNMASSAGATVASLGASTDGRGVLNMSSSVGTNVLSLGVATNDGGSMTVSNSNGITAVELGSSVLGGTLIAYSPNRTPLAELVPTVSGHGAISLKNTSENFTVVMSADTSGNGGISVRNSSGTQTAGIAGSTGTVFGNIKSFIVADPSDSDRMIKYTSLEGPEAAIYVRGTANLVSGQAYIQFPDHFTAMAVPSSTTVTLTPRSTSSMGLAAVDVSSQGIQVAELGGGRNSYAFDYVAHAVRKGYEDYEVYLTKEQASELTGPAFSMVKALVPPKK